MLLPLDFFCPVFSKSFILLVANMGLYLEECSYIEMVKLGILPEHFRFQRSM